MESVFKSRILGRIDAEEIVIGQGVHVEEGVLITGKNGRSSRVVLGDFCFIGRETKILTPEFRIGDYSKLHAHSFAHGDKPLQIGRNCWIGGNTVLDSMGGLAIDDNVGIGSHSQIWTHIRFGDIVEGCRFHQEKSMWIEKDAWFVGHCVVSPVAVGQRSMALAGSVVTREMLPNHVYGGVPAVDLTDKLGGQFEERTVDAKAAKLRELIDAFTARHPGYAGKLLVVTSPNEIRPGNCCFDVSRRVYTKTRSEAEVAFLRAHVPLVKFTPLGEPPFVERPEVHDR
jgi:acetyltransferase-like isoleucine patch superfamily enzyme